MTRPRRTPFLCPAVEDGEPCGKPMVWVRETRVAQGALRRRRQCDDGHAIWTKEVVIAPAA